MSERVRERGAVCLRCGRSFRPLPEPRRRLLRMDPRPLLALCPRCRGREVARRLGNAGS